jgi:hypothetical protein
VHYIYIIVSLVIEHLLIMNNQFETEETRINKEKVLKSL